MHQLWPETLHTCEHLGQKCNSVLMMALSAAVTSTAWTPPAQEDASEQNVSADAAGRGSRLGWPWHCY